MTPPRLRPRAILFDLDGTLVDSAPEITAALNGAMREAGLEPFLVHEVHAFIGGGAAMALRRAVAHRGAAFDDAAIGRLLEGFYAVYAEESRKGRGLYPGAVELLSALAEREMPLGLVTNKSEPIALIALEALGIRNRFGSIIGARDDLPRKPAPDMLHAALGVLGVGAREALMIGDSRADVGAARAAGCPVVAVSYGYAHVPARELGADHVIDHLDELMALLDPEA